MRKRENEPIREYLPSGPWPPIKQQFKGYLKFIRTLPWRWKKCLTGLWSQALVSCEAMQSRNENEIASVLLLSVPLRGSLETDSWSRSAFLHHPACTTFQTRVRSYYIAKEKITIWAAKQIWSRYLVLWLYSN